MRERERESGGGEKRDKRERSSMRKRCELYFSEN